MSLLQSGNRIEKHGITASIQFLIQLLDLRCIMLHIGEKVLECLGHQIVRDDVGRGHGLGQVFDSVGVGGCRTEGLN